MPRSITALLILASTALLAPASAHARLPVDHPESRGWLYADREAQAAAEWVFPTAAHPFGTVIERRGCDLQADGSYDCVYTLGVWSSGRWRGSHAPATVETWACSGPITVTLRRTRRGTIARSSDANPCRPGGAADAGDARMLFVAAVHRRRARLGRVNDVHCYDPLQLAGPLFHCYASTHRAPRISADVGLDGSVVFASPTATEAPRPQPPSDDPGCSSRDATCGAAGAG